MIADSHYTTSCRFCQSALRSVMKLGDSCIANALCETQEEALDARQYPLELMACTARDCALYQLGLVVRPELLFPHNYTYSTPDNPELAAHYRETLGWLHGLSSALDLCVEIGSNNGLFLSELRRWRWRLCIGVEPSAVAADPSVTTLRGFFSDAFVLGPLAEQLKKTPALPLSSGANLIVARHVLAHIDDVHDVMRGVERLLGARGIFYIENAYALDTLMGGQFDQIYHEHLSYFTLTALERLLDEHHMKVLDVRLSRVHGGSIMVAAVRESHPAVPTGSVGLLRLAERTDPLGLERRFVEKACASIAATRSALVGRVFATDAWGAAAKAVTRFAAARITHHIRQCYDDSPLKQGKFLPGSGIPIVACPEELDCDAILLTAWNYERSFRARYASYKGKVIVP